MCTKYITPAIEKAGWNIKTQIREELCIVKLGLSWYYENATLFAHCDDIMYIEFLPKFLLN